MLRIALFTLLVCAGGCDAAEPAATVVAPDSTVLERLDAALAAWAEVDRHRGVSAAVLFPDGEAWEGTAGISAEGDPLRGAHLIWIASITKTITGAVILQLAEEGVLSLEDPLERWLDPRPNIDGRTTLRQLLNHTNGLANYTASPELSAAFNADPARRFTPQELLGYVGPPVFEPGERTQYTNTSFVLLGLVAEEATGRPLPELWEERLFAPLGLEEIFLPGVQPPPGPVATAWINRVQDAVDPMERMSLLSLGSYAFGLMSNARTVVRWGDALFTGDVLGTEMRAAMVEMVPAAGNIPGEAGAGLGIRGYGYLGREQWGHSGGSPFGSSLMLHDPESGVTVAVLMNQGGGADHFALAPELLEIAAGG